MSHTVLPAVHASATRSSATNSSTFFVVANVIQALRNELPQALHIVFVRDSVQVNEECADAGSLWSFGVVDGEVVHVMEEHLQRPRIIVGQVDELGTAFLRQLG